VSLEAITAAWRNSRQKGGALLVVLALADYADDNGLSWPSIERLASKARLSDRQTQAVLRDLATAGEIAIERGRGPKGANRYRILLPIHWGAVSSPPKEAGVQPATPGGEVSSTEGVLPTSPESSRDSLMDSTSKRARRKRRARPGVPAAVELHRRITGVYLPKVTWPRVVRSVGDRLLPWGRLCKSWVSRGYRPSNLEGLLDAFTNGAGGPRRPPRVGGSRPSGLDVLRGVHSASKERERGH